jgi:hypothetical protein
VANSEPSAPPPSATPAPLSAEEELRLTEKVSIRWLFEHVPVAWWFWAASGVVGIFTAGFQAAQLPILQQFTRPHEHASEDIPKIEQLQQEVSDKQQQINTLTRQQKDLRMPLEGVWEYKTTYTKYFGEENTERELTGKAIFLWHGNANHIGYKIYMGAGIYDPGKSPEPFVTLFLEFFLITDKSGIPQQGCSMTGFFDYRTSSNPNFGTPGYRDLEMKGGKIYEDPATHSITEMTCTAARF